MTSIFPDYVSINNQFANTVITQHPEWTVIRNPLDWNCRISMPAHPNQLRVSVATLPLPNDDLFEIMILRWTPNEHLDSDNSDSNMIIEPREGDMIRFQTAESTIAYLERLAPNMDPEPAPER